MKPASFSHVVTTWGVRILSPGWSTPLTNRESTQNA